jgi:hypothetical protein
MKSGSAKSAVQGEGDYASAKKFNEHSQLFVESGKVKKAAQDAAPRNAQEQAAMRDAEAEGRAHAKGRVKGSAGPGQGSDASPGRPKPDKQAPGKNPQGRKPAPEKFPGR